MVDSYLWGILAYRIYDDGDGLWGDFWQMVLHMQAGSYTIHVKAAYASHQIIGCNVTHTHKVHLMTHD